MKFLIVLPAVFFLAYAGHSEHHAHSHAVNSEISAAAAPEKSAIEGALKRAVVSSYNSRPNTYPVVSSSYQSSNSYSAVQPSYSASHSYNSNSYNPPSNTYNPPSSSYNSPSNLYSSSNSYSGQTGYLSVCQKRLNLLHNINKELSEAIAASQGHCANVVTLTNATAQVDILLVNSCGGSSHGLYGAKSAAL